MNYLKSIYIVSLLATLITGGATAYTLWQGLLLDTIYMLAFFSFFYPITLIGTLAYTVKKSLQRMSLFDIMEKAGVSTGLGSMFGGSNRNKVDEKNEEDQEESE